VTGYAMGLIYWWARLAAHTPGLVNLVTQAPLLSDLAKRLGGIAPERRIPAFAPQTFKEWFRQREPRNPEGKRVILWPDTFNNHFHPDTAIAAVEVLEAAGYRVTVPEIDLCCGRPLYDYGWLDAARRLLRQILTALKSEIEAGVPVVGLEPSCVAVFRDELINLFPHDEDARRLSLQSFLLSEFLEREGYQPPKLHRRAVVHGHCHHKAIMRMTAEEAVLHKLGLDFEVLDSGCCGMAGAFGFEREHYDVSIACGERVLLPAVRAAERETLIIANGFSCREQIAQSTDRRALHLAQVLQMALQGERRAAGAYPEDRYIGQPARAGTGSFAVAAAGAVLGGVVLGTLRKRVRIHPD
jgi:Fe-S oxidoreductase